MSAVAILIDVENMHRYLKDEQSFLDLLERIGEYGDVRYRRAYANWSTTQASALYNRVGCELIQTYHPASGKNTADIQIAVDAMDLLALHADIGCFVLATGDSDFSPLFRRLRERGRAVVGCGPRSLLSETVKYHCTYFILANTLKSSEPKPADPAEVVHEFTPQEARKLLIRALKAQTGPVNASLIGETMRKMDPSFDYRLVGCSNLRAFLEQHADLVDLQVQERGAIYVTARKAAPKTTERPEPKENNTKEESADSEPAAPPSATLEAARDLLIRALQRVEEREVNGAVVLQILRELEPDFSYKALGHARFSGFLKCFPDLVETRMTEGNTQLVRARGRNRGEPPCEKTEAS